eukprot:8718309-Lingulodinium_polyedra.AAC.1
MERREEKKASIVRITHRMHGLLTWVVSPHGVSWQHPWGLAPLVPHCIGNMHDQAHNNGLTAWGVLATSPVHFPQLWPVVVDMLALAHM